MLSYDLKQGDATVGYMLDRDPVYDLLYKLNRGGSWGSLWTSDTDETIWYRPGLIPDMSLYSHLKAMYYSVNPRKQNLGLKRRGCIEDVEAVNALYADLDMKDDWSQEKVDNLPIKPTVIIPSGGGWQPLWILKEPVKVTDENRNELNELQHAFVEYIGGDPGAQDIARVLRLPGSYNHKYDPPRLVTFQKVDGPEYDIKELYELVKGILEERKKRSVASRARAAKATTDPVLRKQVEAALSYLGASYEKYEKWFRVVAALFDVFEGSDEGLAIADEWSKQFSSYDYKELSETWESLHKDRAKKTTVGSLFYFADEESNGEFSKLHRQPARTKATFSLTDTGNAERLVRQYGLVMRYNKSHRWITWNGKKWVIDSPHALQFAQDVAKSIFAEAGESDDADQRKRIFKHAEKSLDTYRIKAMLEGAQGMLFADVRAFDDKHKWLLNVENGVLDLRTGQLLPHDPKYMMTKMFGTHYDPTATSMPKIKAFLEMIFPDEGLRKYAQQAAGYSLTGNSDEKALQFLEGDGDNGKSTWIKLSLMLFGEYGASVPVEVVLNTRKGGVTSSLERLYNARFVAADELPKNVTLNTNTVKALTGNDMLGVNPKFRDYYEFHPTHHLWMFGNAVPKLDDPDDAFWNRLRRVKFEGAIPKEIRRPMEEVLAEFKEELPAFLNWALEGLRSVLKEGWQIPQSLMDAVNEFKAEYDYLAQFIEEYGYIVTGDENDLSIHKKDFVAMYNSFRKLSDAPELTMTKITKDLKKYYGVEPGGRGGALYKGIRSKIAADYDRDQSPVEHPALDPHANVPVDDEDEYVVTDADVFHGAIGTDEHKQHIIRRNSK
jgi:P4 family phage/plasmid primase-like protien